MFVPKFTISNSTLKHVGLIEVAKEIITNAPLVPAWEVKFRKDAMERTIHHGTHIEGNPLSDEEVKDILDGKEVLARERDIQEIINLRNTLKFIDSLWQQYGGGKQYVLTPEVILEVHRQTVDQLIDNESAGHYRNRQVVLKNSQTGAISYTPPPAVEVPYLMEDLIDWINHPTTRELHPVIKAGIIHYELARIHPFVEGNGRTARATATLVMYLDGYDIRHFFSLEEYFDSDPMNYYLTLQAVSNQLVMDTHERDLTPWLEYFVQGVAIELNRVKERIQRISTDARVKDALGEQLVLNERQMLIMEYLHRHHEMKNSDFRKIFPDFSDDTVLREMRFLTQKGLVKKVGGTKKAVYMLK